MNSVSGSLVGNGKLTDLASSDSLGLKDMSADCAGNDWDAKLQSLVIM